jgi:hypothetical protein
MTRNSPESMQRVVEKLLIDLNRYQDCSDWDCEECPYFLNEIVEDSRYGRHNCGWLLLKSATLKITRR